VLVDQDRLHQLKEDAKWASSIEGQIKAVRELGSLGKVALPSLEEVLQVSVRDEIKQCCVEAIRNLGRNSMAEASRTKKKSSGARKARRKTRNSAR
jgi:hypothetical protein